MKQESTAKGIAVLMAKLGIICIIVAGLLAWINGLTAPVIDANEQSAFESAMTEVLPNADSFKQADISGFEPSETGVSVSSVYAASNGGFVVSAVCKEGYGGDISVMVGINEDLSVSRIKIMSMSETAGLGAKAQNEEFQSRYSGLKSGIGVEKNNGGSADDNTISAISGATITSRAVTKAVNCALEAAEMGGAR